MTYEQIIAEIADNTRNGYETAVFSAHNGRCVKHGSLITDVSALPDKAPYCCLATWNNNNIDKMLQDYTIID